MSTLSEGLTVRKTERRFCYVSFGDANGTPSSIQESSAMDETERGENKPGSSYLWVGIDNKRMHLHRDMISELVAILTRWHATGTLEK